MSTPESPVIRKPLHPKSITLTLTPARVITLILIIVVGIAWFFFLGLVVGRGYYPEQVLAGKVTPKIVANATNSSLRVLAEGQLPIPATTPAETPRATSGVASTLAEASARAATVQQENAPALPVFAYVFQVASFKETQRAQDLSATLKKDGLTPRVTTSKGEKATWYKVIIEFKGTTKDEAQARSILQKYKITDILLLSKKEVQ